jgi:hypothetical protein
MEQGFLPEKYPDLHSSKEVESAVNRAEKRTDDEYKDIDKIEGKEARIGAYLKRIEKIFEDPETGLKSGITRPEILKDKLHELFVIKEDDIPESYFNLQRRIAREQGHGDVEITREAKQELTQNIIRDQESSMDSWADYLSSPDATYPSWLKYYAFRGMLGLSSYDKEKHTFKKRRKDTTAPFPDINREALAYVLDALEKQHKGETPTDEEWSNLLKGSNFGKLYAHAIEKVTPATEEEKENIEGEWRTYTQGTDATPLYESLQGHGTGWCTAGESTAKAQLEAGDFHIFYSKDQDGNSTIPRIAIRMQGSDIAEVRGINTDQNLEGVVSDTAQEKLNTIPGGEAYAKKSGDMKRLTEIEKRAKEDQLSKDDLRFLYEVDDHIQGFGYQIDPRIGELLKERDLKEDLSYVFDIPKEKISTNKEEALSGDILIHHGRLDLGRLTTAEGLTLPETMNGDLYIGGLTTAEGLTLPKAMNGGLELESLTTAEGLTLPETMNGGLELGGLTTAEGLTLPETMNGILYLGGLTTAEGLTLPKAMNGDLYLSNLTTAEGLTLPKAMNGDLYLSNLTTAEGLTLPETMNGGLYLGGLTTAEKRAIQEKHPDWNIL